MTQTPNEADSFCAVSLFSGAGIGDLGFRAAGLQFLTMCELEADRAALARGNFPEANVITGDVAEVAGSITESTLQQLEKAQQELFLLACTAPCQGMSKNGQGTLLRNIRRGDRPAMDPRNRLILPALKLIKTLRPKWAVFENVIEMRNTVIEEDNREVKFILDVIFDTLAPDYVGEAYDVEFADYGVPQRRQRLITVGTRDEEARRRFSDGFLLIPRATHARTPGKGVANWVSVMDAIGHFPALDASNEDRAACTTVPFHRVPVLDPKKYEWIRHTPLGRSAFDNQCINPECLFQGNGTHGASHDDEGINRAHRDTPLYCQRCRSLLPRPYTEDAGVEGGRRIMSGYTSAYKRMEASLPAPALTRNLSYPCSDQKIHPLQNRVLSLAEAMTLHTMNRYEYRWGPIQYRNGKGTKRVAVAPDSLIRLVIGESVPPLFFELLGRHLRSYTADQLADFDARPRKTVQRTLW